MPARFLWVIFLFAISMNFIGCGQSSSDSLAGTAEHSSPENYGNNESYDNAGGAAGGPSAGLSDSASRDQNSGAPAPGYENEAEPQEVDPDLPTDDDEDELQWIQLSTDDSTSMASAQIFKGNNTFYGFGLKVHEFLNYYDPPIALFQGEGFNRTKDIDESLRFGIKAVYQATPAPEEIETEAIETEDEPSETSETTASREDDSETTDTTETTENTPPTEEPDVAPARAVGELEFLFQMQSDAIEPSARRPWNLFLCVDVSGSMEGEKLAFTIDALRKMLDHLRPGDKVTLTTFNNEARHIFTNLEFSASRAEIEAGINALEAGGGTNMSAGLELSYEAAQNNYSSDMLQRVLLFGDGSANVGDTEIASFNRLTRINGQEGIYLSGIGVGTGYDFERMDQLTDAGKGAHIFLPNREEVDIIFGDYFHKVVEVAADQIAIEVVVPEGIRLSGFSGEEVSFDPNQRLQNIILASGDDMTFTAKFDVLDEAALEESFSLKVTLRPLSTGEETVRKIEVDTLSELIGEPGRLFTRTRLIHRFGQFAAQQTGDKDALISDLGSYENPDWGIREIIDLLNR